MPVHVYEIEFAKPSKYALCARMWVPKIWVKSCICGLSSRSAECVGWMYFYGVASGILLSLARITPPHQNVHVGIVGHRSNSFRLKILRR